MEKYFRINNKELILINSEYNSVEEKDIKISEEVFNYYLTLFDKVYNEKVIEEKELKTIQEFNKYLKDKEVEEFDEEIEEESIVSNEELLNQIADLRIELRNKIKEIEKIGGNN